jgi:hypothetical protein
MFLERKAESLEKGVSLFIGGRGGHESDLEAVDAGVLVDVDFGEDDLLLDTEGVVALAVEFLGNTVEVADTGEG